MGFNRMLANPFRRVLVLTEIQRWLTGKTGWRADRPNHQPLKTKL